MKMMLRTILAVGLALSSVSAFALPILNGSTTAAEGLSNFDIGGTLYDVEFADNGSYVSAFGTDVPLFDGNRAGAVAVLRDIVDALTALNVTGIANVPSTTAPHYLFVPYATTVSFAYGGQSAQGSTTWNRTGTYSTSPTQSWNNISYVRFQPLSVSEPMPLMALSMGVVALIFVRRRRVQ